MAGTGRGVGTSSLHVFEIRTQTQVVEGDMHHTHVCHNGGVQPLTLSVNYWHSVYHGVHACFTLLSSSTTSSHV